ncbi:hypothetical protein U1Q18_036140 [Sarracenia purpurea var. burkii]
MGYLSWDRDLVDGFTKIGSYLEGICFFHGVPSYSASRFSWPARALLKGGAFAPPLPPRLGYDQVILLAPYQMRQLAVGHASCGQPGLLLGEWHSHHPLPLKLGLVFLYALEAPYKVLQAVHLTFQVSPGIDPLLALHSGEGTTLGERELCHWILL